MTDNVRIKVIPLGWAVIALIAQIVFVTVMVPRLPSPVLLWFQFDSASVGDGVYRFAPADLATVGNVIVAIFVVGAVAASFAPIDTGWALAAGLAVSAVAPPLVVVELGSTLWQLGMAETPETIPSLTGGLIVVLTIGAVFLGLGSYFIFGRKKSTSAASSLPQPWSNRPPV